MKPLLSILFFASITSFAQNQAVLVHDISPGKFSGEPYHKLVYKGKMVYTSKGGRFVYNDTTFTKLDPGTIYHHRDMAIADDKLFFCGSSPTNSGNRLKMWDGVNPPTLVHNSIDSNLEVSDIVSLKDKIYFTGNSFATKNYIGLWQYDPVVNTYRKITDSIRTFVLTVFDNKIWYVTSIYNSSNKLELYTYDPLQDKILPAPNFNTNNFEPLHANVIGNKLYFSTVAVDPVYRGRELFMYDGINPPVRLTDINPFGGHSLSDTISRYIDQSIIEYKGHVYFTANDGTSDAYQLYRFDPKTDISNSNPAFVANISSSGTVKRQMQFIEFDGKLYFEGSDTAHGKELWVYDGNTASMLTDINPGKADGNPKYFVVYNDSLYFTATDTVAGTELFKLGKKSVHIQNVTRVNDIKVYPVPAENLLNFEMDMKTAVTFTITLTDMSGREVYNSGEHKFSAGAARLQADVTQLATGNYCYLITSDDGVRIATGKIIKQ